MPVLPMSIGAVRSEGTSRDIPGLQVSLVRAAATACRGLSRFSGKMECFRQYRPDSTLRLFVVERHRVKLEPVIDQAIAEPARDLRLQALDLVRLKLDDGAGAQVDQMIVMRVGNLFVARPALAEIMPLDDTGVLE